MKKTLTKLLMAVTIMGAFAIVSFAQDGRERVRFAKGKTSAVVTRTLSGDSGVITFLVRARKGQRMHFTIESEAAVNIELSESGAQDFSLRSEVGEPNEFIVRATKDHFITVVNPTQAKTKITLRLSVK